MYSVVWQSLPGRRPHERGGPDLLCRSLQIACFAGVRQCLARGLPVLETLKELHNQILRSLTQIESLTQSEEGPPLALAGARYTLTKASRSRTRLLETEIYPYLLEAATLSERAGIMRLQIAGQAQLAGSTSHISAWDMRTMTAKWSDYRAASLRIRTQMQTRVVEEQRLIYPLLEAAALSKASRF